MSRAWDKEKIFDNILVCILLSNNTYQTAAR